MTTKIRMNKENGNSTWYQGKFNKEFTYKGLVKIFGLPKYPHGDGEKVRKEWVGTINDMPFNIYDWKSEENIYTYTEWHIGGNDKKVVNLLNEYCDGGAA